MSKVSDFKVGQSVKIIGGKHQGKKGEVCTIFTDRLYDSIDVKINIDSGRYRITEIKPKNLTPLES